MKHAHSDRGDSAAAEHEPALDSDEDAPRAAPVAARAARRGGQPLEPGDGGGAGFRSAINAGVHDEPGARARGTDQRGAHDGGTGDGGAEPDVVSGAQHDGGEGASSAPGGTQGQGQGSSSAAGSSSPAGGTLVQAPGSSSAPQAQVPAPGSSSAPQAQVPAPGSSSAQGPAQGAYPPALLARLRFAGGFTPQRGQAAPPGTEGFIDGEHFIVFADAIQVGGHLAWRCRNPGALRSRYGGRARSTYPGAITIEMHAPRSPHGFIVFESAAHGVAAQEAVLRAYARRGMSIGAAMRLYTDGDPRGEGYVRWVSRHFGGDEAAPFLPAYVPDTSRMILGNEGPRAGRVVAAGDADWAAAVYGR